MKYLPKLSLRALLPLSLALNLLLGAALVWNGSHPHTPAPSAAIPRPPAPKKIIPLAVAKAKPFQWRQLEAPDFATYVKNLRAIGCPEPTIRDIVAGELAEIYEQKRQQLAATTTSKSLLQAEAMQLTAERDGLLANLTAPPTATVATSPSALTIAVQASNNASKSAGPTSQGTMASASPGSANLNAAVNKSAANIPVAFTYGSTAGAAQAPSANQGGGSAPTSNPQLPPATAATLQQLKSDFVSALGDSVQDPQSAVYRQRWNEALIQSNSAFSAMFGGETFVRAQIQAVQQQQQAPAAAATK